MSSPLLLFSLTFIELLILGHSNAVFQIKANDLTISSSISLSCPSGQYLDTTVLSCKTCPTGQIVGTDGKNHIALII